MILILLVYQPQFYTIQCWKQEAENVYICNEIWMKFMRYLLK